MQNLISSVSNSLIQIYNNSEILQKCIKNENLKKQNLFNEESPESSPGEQSYQNIEAVFEGGEEEKEKEKEKEKTDSMNKTLISLNLFNNQKILDLKGKKSNNSKENSEERIKIAISTKMNRIFEKLTSNIDQLTYIIATEETFYAQNKDLNDSSDGDSISGDPEEENLKSITETSIKKIRRNTNISKLDQKEVKNLLQKQQKIKLNNKSIDETINTGRMNEMKERSKINSSYINKPKKIQLFSPKPQISSRLDDFNQIDIKSRENHLYDHFSHKTQNNENEQMKSNNNYKYSIFNMIQNTRTVNDESIESMKSSEGKKHKFLQYKNVIPSKIITKTSIFTQGFKRLKDINVFPFPLNHEYRKLKIFEDIPKDNILTLAPLRKFPNDTSMLSDYSNNSIKRYLQRKSDLNDNLRYVYLKDKNKFFHN